jgi:UDP-N-acetylmuramoyl-tripeptide--D-alanyl-D-alanine ligase
LPGIIKKIRFAVSFGKHGALRTFLRARRNRRALQRALKRREENEAVFIGVNGSSGKSTTTALLGSILTAAGKVRSQVLYNQLHDLVVTMKSIEADEKFVVVEVAVDKVGDMLPQAELLSPDVAVVTMISMEHYTAFKTREAIANEKSALVSKLTSSGLAILNADDPLVMGMASQTSARLVTYGWSEAADYRVMRVAGKLPESLTVHIKHKGSTFEIHTKLYGEHFWVPVAAATAAAIELGLSVEQVRKQIPGFDGIFGRCTLYEVPNGPRFILDTAKAPYETLGLAFDVIKDVSAATKWIVLGQISDYSGNPRTKYKRAYKAASSIADKVVFIGSHSHRSGATDDEIKEGRFSAFRTFFEALTHIKANAKEGDLVLIKGSQNMHLERIAFAFDHDVRCLEEVCGHGFSCPRCGLYEHAFSEHVSKKKSMK